MKEEILFCWSGGKDSALALYELLKSGEFNVTLLTTITQDYRRVSMHGVREALLEKQADVLGLPLEKVYIRPGCINEEYEHKMEEALGRHKQRGVARVAFGDIFLEDVRAYRENNLRKVGLRAVFPLWGIDSKELAAKFLELGFKSIVVCVDTNVLGGEFVGRVLDRNFLSDLPSGVDPCGENGEFHSFVYNGPIFKEEIPFSVGDKVLREERFFYCDLTEIG